MLKSSLVVLFSIGFVFWGIAGVTVPAGESASVANDMTLEGDVIVNGVYTLQPGVTVSHPWGTTKIGNGNGMLGVMNLESDASFLADEKNQNREFWIGVEGGTGRVSVASGATLTVGKVRIPNNNYQRNCLSYGILDLAGTLRSSLFETTAFFPTNLVEGMSLADAGCVYLREGGLLDASSLQKNDYANFTFLFDGGTLKIKSLYLSTLKGGTLNLNVADGKQAIIDIPSGSLYFPSQYVVFQPDPSGAGTGGLTKRGEGNLYFDSGVVAESFTGPIFVEEGALSLGRPLLPSQTVTVSPGAWFIPFCDADREQVTTLPSEEPPIYRIMGMNDLSGLDLSQPAGAWRQDALRAGISPVRIAGPIVYTGDAGSSVTNPFTLYGNQGSLTLSETGLSSKWLAFDGWGLIRFADPVVWNASHAQDAIQFRNQRVQVAFDYKDALDAGSPDVVPSLVISDSNATAQVVWTNGNVFAENLTVGKAGTGDLTLSSDNWTVADYLHIGFGNGATGTVSVLGGSLFATNLFVGRLGGCGKLDLRDGAVTAYTVYLSANSGVSTDLLSRRSVSELSISNAELKCVVDFRLTSWWPQSNDTLRLMTAAVVRLQKDGVLNTKRLYKNDAPHVSVSFEGGLLRSYAATDTFITSGQYGMLELTGKGGNDVRLSIDHNGGVVGRSSEMGQVLFSGDCNVRKTGAKPLYLSAGTRMEQSGDLIIEDGFLAMRASHLLGFGGVLSLASGSYLDLNGTVNEMNDIIPVGSTVTNSSSSQAVLGLYGDNRSVTNNLPFLYGDIVLRKMGTGTLSLGGVKLNHGLEIADGCVDVTKMDTVQFKHYRLKINKCLTSSDSEAMQISELSFLCDGVDVTSRHVGLAFDETGGYGTDKDLSAFPPAELPKCAVDGSLDSKWLDFRMRKSHQYAGQDRTWLIVSFENPQRITAYNWATANDAPARDPVSWTLEGSFDQQMWYEVDRQTGFTPPTERQVWVTESGFPVSLPDVNLSVFGTNSFVRLHSNAELILREGQKEEVDSLIGSGTLTIEENAALFVRGSETNRFCGTLQGAGNLEMAQSGLLYVNTKNYTGTLVTSGGSFVLGQSELAPSWFRLKIRNTVTGSDGCCQAAEFALYDQTGSRVNLGMTAGSYESLQPGQFATPVSYSVGSPNESEGCLFDGDLTTKLCWNKFSIKESDPSTWRELLFRLPDGVQAVSYNFATANDLPSMRDPGSWSLEASVDGVHWMVVDDQRAFAAPVARFAWYNDGSPFVFASAGEMGAVSKGLALEVKNGASVELVPNMGKVSSLSVSMNETGTISGFMPNEKGVLALRDVQGDIVSGMELPLALENPGDLSALSTWTVTVDGVEKKGVTVTYADGKLTLLLNGTLFLLR